MQIRHVEAFCTFSAVRIRAFGNSDFINQARCGRPCIFDTLNQPSNLCVMQADFAFSTPKRGSIFLSPACIFRCARFFGLPNKAFTLPLSMLHRPISGSPASLALRTGRSLTRFLPAGIAPQSCCSGASSTGQVSTSGRSRASLLSSSSGGRFCWARATWTN